ncbi:cytochrome P450 [Nonomuraea sp. NBC_01738]|uniref:cytochrome P450 n=1 Tax=Nonomuraea sp. NBC_01738 TaxID=2976003 RepID=UPI002E158F06|nr:cytochrome P450 [Nonomuraea sp. NBC_01738]
MSDQTLPLQRDTPFGPPDKLYDLRDEGHIHPMTYADGHQGWLVTGYAAARAVLSDPRFSNRPERLHPPIPQRAELSEGVKEGAIKLPPGFFIRMDAPEHTRYRKLLAGQFTVRRMKALEPRIEEITAGCLEKMAAGDRPADLVEDFALPIPSLVICELLGVPYEDRDNFHADSRVLTRLEVKKDDVMAAVGRLSMFMYELIQRKRDEPGDDLLSGLVAGGELTDEELTGVAFLLLVAGHETTANMLALGTFALLTHPEQLAKLRDDPAVAENAVEELLRYLTIIHIGPVRAALADVELDGRLIREGDSVTISLPVVNRDPERFDDPDALDLTRHAGTHLAFGHGIHQCLGQQLARAEMRIAYPALLRRFPGLELAVPAQEVPMRTDMSIYGVHRLPVTW